MYIAITGINGKIGRLLLKNFLNTDVKLIGFYRSKKPNLKKIKNIRLITRFFKKPLPKLSTVNLIQLFI